ncbi:MAG: alanine:cation symporter family protein [Candidatus Riflebacteria bacterium]|nr:alanine:cation symporter family protein [Candidatus Riflebacteria bacterium]
MSFIEILGAINGIVWGVPMMALILLGGLWLTIRVKCLQIHKLGLALKWMFKNEEGGTGEVSSFAALCTALSATIGTGNIVGVATAVTAGGPGALFWMELTAFLGMATKYAEGLLAVKYRTVDEAGHALGGPFYYIEKGMGEKWKWLAKIFAFFGAAAAIMGIGTITQVKGIVDAMVNFFDPDKLNMIQIPGVGSVSIVVVIGAALVSFCAGAVLIGGLKRIATITSIIVPFMAVIYILAAIILLLCNLSAIPAALMKIIEGAFNPAAVTGGVVGSMIVAMQKGVARGIFSNEAGLGSAPIAAAAAQTNEPVRQGLVSMTGTFIDTIVICTMTGLSIVITGAYAQNLDGVAVTSYAFSQGLPFSASFSNFLLMMCLIFFAFTTILGWNYYAERCLEYLTNGNLKAIKVYRWFYILSVFVGPFLTVTAVWTIADILNGLMASPNMIALFVLSGVVAKETKDFFAAGKHLK